MEKILYKVNAIKNILKTKPTAIKSIYIFNITPKILWIINKALLNNIKINYLTKEYKNNNHLKKNYDLIAKLKVSNFTKNLNIIKKYKKILILYNMQDPHNISSCIRNAEAFGVELVIITQNNTIKIDTLIDNISNGSSLFIKILKIRNFSKIIKTLKENNFYLMALSIKGETKKIKKYEKIAIILGSEKSGIKNSIIKKCHCTYKIITQGKCNSINVAVATGIILNTLQLS